jgi:fructokinase
MIVSCGESLIDFVPVATGRGPGYLPVPGGSLFNVAISMARLGTPAGYLGKISHDFFGQRLLATLEDNGVRLDFVVRGAEPTPLAFVSTGEGEPQYAFFGEGATDRSLHLHDVPASLSDEVEALHFGSYALAVHPTASTLSSFMRREQGQRLLSLDPNIRPTLIHDRKAYLHDLHEWLGLVDLVKVSVADLEWIAPGEPYEAVARRWQETGPALVVVTIGKDGALALWKGGEVRRPAVPAEVVDTVGAGDSFIAGLLTALREAGHLTRQRLEAPVEDVVAAALDFAAKVAAITCGRAGADPPRRSEV